MDRVAQEVEITWQVQARAAVTWLHNEAKCVQGKQGAERRCMSQIPSSINAGAPSPAPGQDYHFNTGSKPLFALFLITGGQFHIRLD